MVRKTNDRIVDLSDEAGETLLPEVEVAVASDDELLRTASMTWSNASCREAVVARFAALGRRAWPVIERALELPRLPPFHESMTAVVTAIGVGCERRSP